MATAAVNWGDPRLPERFWDKVSPEPTSGCWLWLGARDAGRPGFSPRWVIDRSRSLVSDCARTYVFRSLVGGLRPKGLLTSLCGFDECMNPAHMKPRGIDRRERYAIRTRSKRYGISESAFHGMVKKQSGLCAVCADPISVSVRGGLHVDHDHETGAVRELLCSRCNTGLGQFRERPDLLRAAADYLVRHGKPETP